ncbi:periplasmic chaperone for outer membrane proteins Skp [Spirosomataceae bacterium TFI 002]|nr:periplasmic chaperone for outer membrane proteins Skp [Spirosomataceae bacterium TFI 002]
MKKIIFFLFILSATTTTFGQTSKVGTIDSDFILSKMPEMAQTQDSLTAYREKLGSQLAEKTANYEKIYKAAEAVFDSLSDEAKRAKQEELATLENDVNNFRRNGTQLIELKQDQLMRPLYQKIGVNVATVAKQLGYTQILNISNNDSLAYIDPEFDISEKVLLMMGISIVK